MQPKPDMDALVARIDGMQKAVDLLQKNADKMPSSDTVAGRIDQLREVHQTKFDNVDARLLERETREKNQAMSRVATVTMIGVVVQCVTAGIVLLGALAGGIAYIVSRTPVVP